MRAKIRWGILGTGQIARKFATGLQLLPDAELIAIGSRSMAKAQSFANEFSVPTRHDSYGALLNDDRVEAVYIATPHSLHFQNTRAALLAGKPVLCEKPFTINAREAAELVRLAREKKLLLMEAMWTRFVPLHIELRRILAAGTLGELRILTANFGFRGDPQKHARLYDTALGGGALLDIGIYPVSLASMVFGSPKKITSIADIKDGVDGQNGMVLLHDNGALGILYSTIEADTFCEAEIVGAGGRIKIHSPWWRANAMTLIRGNENPVLLEYPYEGNGYQFEAAEFMNCLRDGKLESAIMPLDETVSVMQTLDQLRALWGLRYPGE